jgi:hypothetical protein
LVTEDGPRRTEKLRAPIADGSIDRIAAEVPGFILERIKTSVCSRRCPSLYKRDFAIAGMFNLSFAGVPFILLGLAVALDGIYPRWLRWLAAFAGLFSVAAGSSKPSRASPPSLPSS